MRALVPQEVVEYVPPEDDREAEWILERHRELDERDEHLRKLQYIQDALERISKRLDEMTVECQRRERRRRR